MVSILRIDEFSVGGDEAATAGSSHQILGTVVYLLQQGSDLKLEIFLQSIDNSSIQS